MTDEVDIPRKLPVLSLSPSMFGFDLVQPAADKMVAGPYKALKLHTGQRFDAEPANLSGIGFALFAPPGSGKTAVASEVVRELRARLGWLTTLHAPWMTAEWIALNNTPHAVCKLTSEPVTQHLINCRLLCIDGLGEENEKLRDRVVHLVKNRLDQGRPLVITSRLALDGPGSLGTLYPNLRAMLDARFVYAAPKR